MQPNSVISEVMAEFGRRNKGKPLTAKKRKSVLTNARRAWLMRTLRACQRHGLSTDQTLALVESRPKLSCFTKAEIVSAYQKLRVRLS